MVITVTTYKSWDDPASKGSKPKTSQTFLISASHLMDYFPLFFAACAILGVIWNCVFGKWQYVAIESYFGLCKFHILVPAAESFTTSQITSGFAQVLGGPKKRFAMSHQRLLDPFSFGRVN